MNKLTALIALTTLIGCAPESSEDLSPVVHDFQMESTLHGDRYTYDADVLVGVGDRAPHAVTVEMTRPLARGDADITVTVTDETADIEATYFVYDEAAELGVELASGSRSVTVESDGSVTFDGVTFEDPEAAGEALALGAADGDLSAENLAALITVLEALEEEADDTSRVSLTVALIPVVAVAIAVGGYATMAANGPSYDTHAPYACGDYACY